MSIVSHAVIAAAGMGTRLGLGFPKCLFELGGKPLIAHLLENLKGIEDIRVVTGFQETEVMAAVATIRKDVIFVRNPSYRSTTTLTSYVLGARYIEQPCLFMDADIFFQPASFHRFLRQCTRQGSPVIGVTRAKTQDAVFVDLDDRFKVTRFSRRKPTDWEWGNLAYLPPNLLEDRPSAVFEQLSQHLPLQAIDVESYEIDREEDVQIATKAYEQLENS